MSTNISKQKRDDLLTKIEEIRRYISNAAQDENTGNLLSYLSEIEKDINGKKYGLVFEEHREDIDEVLETHTPVLTEETDLFIEKRSQNKIKVILDRHNFDVGENFKEKEKQIIESDLVLTFFTPEYKRKVDTPVEDSGCYREYGYILKKKDINTRFIYPILFRVY